SLQARAQDVFWLRPRAPPPAPPAPGGACFPDDFRGPARASSRVSPALAGAPPLRAPATPPRSPDEVDAARPGSGGLLTCACVLSPSEGVPAAGWLPGIRAATWQPSAPCFLPIPCHPAPRQPRPAGRR